jgi:hypothetical protein
MNLQKLKIDSFNNIALVNFPDSIDLGIDSTERNVEVVLFYINSVDDVAKFVDYCDSLTLPTENRTIMIYRKGRKDGVNRDSIFMPFKESKYRGYKLKAPMLCSLSTEFSACVMRKEA